MKPAKIRFKGYEWEHNPETLKVVTEENISEHKLPYGTSYTSKNSTKCRVVTGGGKFAGYDCIAQFNELLKLQKKPLSGVLTLPEQKPFYAYFKKLELKCEPTDNVVSYSFEFLEDSEKNYTYKEKTYHTVESGETLWDIAFNYNENIDELVKLNPEIKRVDELDEGSSVRIC